MRTNIVIEDELMERARQLSGLQTKRDVVEKALRLFINHYEQQQVRELRGQLKWEDIWTKCGRGVLSLLVDSSVWIDFFNGVKTSVLYP